MILSLYTLNLGTPAPTPTGTGCYGPWLLYGLNLAPVGASASLPVDFLAAVNAAFGASAAADAIPGGIYTVQPGLTTPLPYCVFEEVSAGLSFASSSSKFRRTRVRFKVYDDDPDAASIAGDTLEDAFSGRTFAFVGGITSPFVIGDRGHKAESMALANSGRQGWYVLVEFNTHIRRGG